MNYIYIYTVNIYFLNVKLKGIALKMKKVLFLLQTVQLVLCFWAGRVLLANPDSSFRLADGDE